MLMCAMAGTDDAREGERSSARPRRAARGDDAMTKANDASAPAAADGAEGSFDVPAAVVCASCGAPDCVGCAPGGELPRSAILTVVPWERPGPMASRLWATARASTRDAEAFFERLPDGALGPALAFAWLAELAALASMLGLLAALFAAAAPSTAAAILRDSHLRAVAWRLSLALIPAFATLLAAAHALHGAALAWGARRAGVVHASYRRAVRFGLYACGWDLVMTPVGLTLVLTREGLRALGRALEGGVPLRATRAFVRGAFQREDDGARPIARAGLLGAGVATVACVAGVLAALLAVLA